MKLTNPNPMIRGSLTALCFGFGLACGGGGSTDTTLSSSGLETGTGTFVDAPVSGLEYTSGSLTGITDESGRFTYEVGQSVRFKLAGLEIGEVTSGEHIVTPADLREDDPSGEHEELTNLLRLLQSLDDDSNPDNGIEIPEDLRQSADLADVELRIPREDFESDSRVRQAVEGRGGNLVTRINAWRHFQEQTERLPQRRDRAERNIQAPEDLRERLQELISDLSTPLVDTAQKSAYDVEGNPISTGTNSSLFGQDANYHGLQQNLVDHGDGTVTDLITGLMWQTSPGDKLSFREGINKPESDRTADYDDWRVPTIKELYSLIRFNGVTGTSSASSKPYLNDRVFNFHYGDETGERFIDAQYMSATTYVSTTMGGEDTVFGVNFADGRIKGYPQDKDFYLLLVRGRDGYGENRFSANVDGTVSDSATGLTWLQDDSGAHLAGPRTDGFMNWEEALEWAENLEYAGHDDWRLPNAKELQSIVDYTRSPATTDSAAIDPVFSSTAIEDEGGNRNFGFYWTGTSHLDGLNPGSSAVYICFGEALGFMTGPDGSTTLMDVHGAGAQRSDPKAGNPSEFPTGHGPQGDVIRIYNLVRPVRGGFARVVESERAQERDSRTSDRRVRDERPDSTDRERDTRSDISDRPNPDTNQDGVVTRDEFISVAPEGESDRAAEFFDGLDTNNDRVLDEDERPRLIR